MRKRVGRIGLVIATIFALLTGIPLPAANAGLSTISTLSSGFTWAGSKSATLSPTTGWTAFNTATQDDRYLNLALGFNVLFEGVNYNTIQIHSNTYIGFSNLNSSSAPNDTTKASAYSGLTPATGSLPAIYMCATDNSYQYVYYRFENNNTQLRVRYEGNNATSGTVGSPTIIYEALFTQNSSVIDIGMGVNSRCDQAPGTASLLGVTNGADTTLEAYWPTATYSSGYTLSLATGVKNNDYRISAGPSISSFTSAQASPTNSTANIDYTLTMSSSISGLAAADLSNAGTATGCSFTPSASSGTTFTITVSGCSEGTLIPQLLANSVLDGASTQGPSANTASSKTIVLDRTAPTIASVTATNGNYSAALNANLNLTVNFSESVTVTGTPRIPITIGTTSRYANFVSLTDSKTATFRFTVTVDYNDIDLNGISVLSPLETNTGTIADLATNAMAVFTFTPPTTTSVNVFQPPSAPTIDSITANNTSLSINFTAGASNGSVISNYKYSLNGGAFTALSPVDSTTPLVLTGLTNGTTYSIQIKAVSNLEDGLASNIVSQAPTASARLSIFLTASATTAVKGTLITITANISQAGVVTFFWNDKRISGCIKKSATTAATCQWRPNVTGQWSVQALLDPTDPTYVDSYSPKLPVFILSRSGNR